MTRSRHGGFTFIETILVLVVIGTGLFGLTYLYSNISYQMYHADLQVIAAEFAHQKMEQQIAQKAFNGYATMVSGAAESVNSGPNTFTRTTEAVYVDPATMTISASDTGYKRITVTVSIPTGPSVTVTSLVTNQVPL